jgi:ABC-type phosphate transport system substrate-binding protein
MRARVLSVAALVLVAATARAADVAIVVHRDNPQSDVSLVELRRLFRLDEQRWKAGGKVDLVMQAGVSAKQDVILARVLRLRAEDLSAFWLGKVFRGELTAPPRSFASDLSVRQYVSTNPSALGYIDAALVDSSVKVLRIDGKAPGEAGYVLAREAGTAGPTPSPATHHTTE